MSTEEKMKQLAQKVGEKTREYAPIVKENLKVAYSKCKDFTVNVAIPEMKKGVATVKTKIEAYQAQRKETASKDPSGKGK